MFGPLLAEATEVLNGGNAGGVLGGLCLLLTVYFGFREKQDKRELESLKKLVGEQGEQIARQDKKIDQCEAEKDDLTRWKVVQGARIYALENALTDHNIPFRRWTDSPPDAHPSDTHRALDVPRPKE
jgi:hypothetical protein